MAASSARIEQQQQPPSTALNFCFPTNSFTDLLSSDDYPIIHNNSNSAAATKGLGDRIAERTGPGGVPKFKSFPPPSLPLSPPPVSPSSYFAFPPGLSPTMLLDSPVLLYGSNILPSPTTGNVSGEAFNWKNDLENFNQRIKQEEKYQSEFSFRSQSPVFESQSNKIPLGQINHNYYVNMQDSNNEDGFSPEKNPANNYHHSFSPETANLQNNSPARTDFQQSNNHQKQPLQTINAKTKSEDGYNWRKYGQKQVKGSENPRSYYKCTYPNCLTRKILEKSIDGHISQIVYKGNHNHPMPQSKKRSSSSSNSCVVHHPYSVRCNDSMDQSYGSGGNGQLDSANTADNSSISVGDDDFGQSSEISKPIDDEEPQAKRWKNDSQNEDVSGPRCRTIREPRVVVQTTSEIDILIDGYRWRKYGQKAVRANPNPRSYYKCTYPGCPVRKHVERASDNPKSVITTYEGKHTHDIPAPRGSGNTHSLYRPSPTNVNNTNSVASSSGNHQVPYTLQMLQNPEMYSFTDL